MRFSLQIGKLPKIENSTNQFTPDWVAKLLPVKNHFTAENIDLVTFQYETNDKSIMEINWDKPFFYNEEHFIFISGHVFYRNNEADKIGKYVPTPKEVLEIIIHKGDTYTEIIKGNYHIICYSRKTNSTSIYSSPFSLYPAWYLMQDDILYISNLMECLTQVKKDLAINPQGLAEFSLFDHCLHDRTIYNNIFSLIGGYKINFCETQKSIVLVYDIRKWITKTPKKRSESIKEINKKLDRHISEFTQSVKRFNISLTGGFDGRLNFAFIKKKDYHRLQAFSYGMKDSLQLNIPEKISNKLNFNYKAIYLENEFENQYASLGLETIIISGGITPFQRANYPYGYGKLSTFSRNCILGQCDMIRPLLQNPAGAIFNEFSHAVFYNDSNHSFKVECEKLAEKGFLKADFLNDRIIDSIYETIDTLYITPYPDLSRDERFFLFLYKESMIKYWHTECHVVDLFVNDFISFSDLDYIEALSHSEYFGLYKGSFSKNPYNRRRGQDLYADLMYLNNKSLNDIPLDRFFKPKWIRRAPWGYLMIAFAKWKGNRRKRKIGNDTFGGLRWSSLFYKKFAYEIDKPNKNFNLLNLKTQVPYKEHHNYRYDRHISLKLWLQHIGLD